MADGAGVELLAGLLDAAVLVRGISNFSKRAYALSTFVKSCKRPAMFSSEILNPLTSRKVVLSLSMQRTLAKAFLELDATIEDALVARPSNIWLYTASGSKYG